MQLCTVEVKIKVKVIDFKDNEEEGVHPLPYCPGTVKGHRGPEKVSEPYNSLRRELGDMDQQGELLMPRHTPLRSSGLGGEREVERGDT